MARWGRGVVKRHSCGVKGQRMQVTNSDLRESENIRLKNDVIRRFARQQMTIAAGTTTNERTKLMENKYTEINKMV